MTPRNNEVFETFARSLMHYDRYLVRIIQLPSSNEFEFKKLITSAKMSRRVLMEMIIRRRDDVHWLISTDE